MNFRIFFIVYIFLFSFFLNDSFASNNRIVLIQDAEIEDFLKKISMPIFKSAGLNKDEIKFYIVNDNSINAFVTNGQNIFINTGTLTNFNTPDAILGIIAHETGHIAGGHIARSNEVYSNISNIGIGSILLGVGALLAGVPEVAEAIIFGGLQVQQQSALKYTRAQEESADALAVRYLNDNNLSAKALLYSMEKFYMEQLDNKDYEEYYSTHPLARNRKQFLESKIGNEKNLSNSVFNKKYESSFNFIKAKILAYQINQSGQSRIHVQKGSDYEKYANAIINMNKNETNLALIDCNFLIDKYKNNPYFYELKGDIYLKRNDAKSALINYEKSDQIIKDNVLIKKMIAYIIIKYEQSQMYYDAIDKLNFIIQKDGNDNSALRLLAEVYYKNNELSMSYLSLAKYYKNLKNDKQVKRYIDLAKKNTNDSKILIKIDDLGN